MQTNSLNIFKASAGSGKTYTLTREYLRLVLRQGTGPRNILAITFTNAATADMKRKIVETLAEVACGKYADWQGLLDGTGIKNETALRGRALSVLRFLLHTWQDFSIKTIDSFVQNLIKPFAFELGLPQNYTPNIEETRLSEEITQKIIDDFGLPGMETQTEFLRRFLEHRNETGKSLDLSQSLQQVVNLLFSERSFEALESMKDIGAEQFNGIIARLKAECAKIERSVAEALQQGWEIIQGNQLEASDFHGGSKGVYGWFAKGAEGGMPDAKFLQAIVNPNATVQNGIGKGVLKKDSPEAEALTGLCQRLTSIDIGNYFLFNEIQNSIYALALVSRAEEVLEDIKETTSVIPISEFNKRIDRALSSENNNFIFERSGSRYTHVFIDEFQDTSRLQWKNLRPLLEENLSQGNECLIVGDPKQSIYRFRNADMEQFVQLCRGNGDMAVNLNNLQSNWRSEPGIIAFNNDFYRFVSQNSNDLMREVLQGHEQFYRNQTDTLPEADLQAVRLFIARNMGGDCLDAWYLEQTLRIVRQFDPGDVTVLCRKRIQCTAVANFLVANGIAVSTPDSLVLSAHTGLNLVMHSLRYIDSRQRFYMGMCFVLAKQLGLWQDGTETNDFYEAWKGKACQKTFSALANLNREQADVYDTVEAVLRFWNMNGKTDQYLLTFLDTVQNGRFGSLSALIEWWDANAGKTPVCPVKNQDCVTVMTIHRSKGLEFKVVVMPFICDTPMNRQDLFWTSPGSIPAEIGLPAALVRYVNAVGSGQTGQDMEHERQLVDIDNLNVLYVATTRPRHKLFLLCAEPSKNPGGFSSAWSLCRFADAHPEYIEQVEDGATLPEPIQAETLPVMPTPAAPEAQTTPPASAAPATPAGPWRSRMQSARFDIQPATPEMEWGNFIHRVLSHIATANEASLQRALDAGLNEYPHLKPRREQALEFIRSVLENPSLRPYFSAGCQIKRETGMADAEGNIHIPDRVAIHGNTAVVLDYKTGAPHKSHAEQVRRYMKLLRDTGMECSQGFLVYLGDRLKVEEVS
ncbi:MAG: UvrD-helicase domain-containing protein [Bacteroides sp.]|nr:UvrD-helicase domain-containing protein [Bacteroides sp.]MCM1085972.1 UvrD-helicase domain-containing protein [Bacteroides sp.]